MRIIYYIEIKYSIINLNSKSFLSNIKKGLFKSSPKFLKFTKEKPKELKLLRLHKRLDQYLMMDQLYEDQLHTMSLALLYNQIP